MGRLTLNILLSFAQFEREVTGERIRDKIAASKRKGMWMGGVVPMGYRVEDRQLIVAEEDAKIVRRIFDAYVDQGCVSKLRLYLEDLGIRSKVRVSKTGKQTGGVMFSRGALYELLQNRIYLGRNSAQGGMLPRTTQSNRRPDTLGQSPNHPRRQCAGSPERRANRPRNVARRPPI